MAQVKLDYSPTLDQNIKNAMAQKGVATPEARAASGLGGVLSQMEELVSAGTAENVAANKSFATDFAAPRVTDNNPPPPPPKPTSLGDANYAIAKSILEKYNITGLADALSKIRADYPDISSEQMMDLLRYDSRYNTNYLKRFSANEARAKNGLPMLDEKTYLTMEQGYKQLFESYNLKTFANQSQYDSLIAGDVSVAEAQNRVSLAYDTVLKGDPNTLKAFEQYYPELSTSDLVATVLDPKTQMPALQRKIQSAEIGGAAIAQGLNASAAASQIAAARQQYTNVTEGTIGSDAIMNAGITKATAAAGYEKVAGELPIANKLSAIYGNTLGQYGQVESEQANILGLASAKRKKEMLTAREAASFAGQTGQLQSAYGVSRTSFGSSSAGLV